MAKGQFKSSDLPIVDGGVYHLDLRPEELAENIIIVGDPDRVTFIADEFLGAKEIDRFHRGLRTITGYVKETGQTSLLHSASYLVFRCFRRSR